MPAQPDQLQYPCGYSFSPPAYVHGALAVIGCAGTLRWRRGYVVETRPPCRRLRRDTARVGVGGAGGAGAPPAGASTSSCGTPTAKDPVGQWQLRNQARSIRTVRKGSPHGRDYLRIVGGSATIQSLLVSGRIALRKPSLVFARDKEAAVLFSPFIAVNADRWITRGLALYRFPKSEACLSIISCAQILSSSY